IDDLRAHQEIAPVDPDLRPIRGMECTHLAAGTDIGEMIGQRRTYRQEAGDLPALPEARDHVVQVYVRQAIAIVGEEHLLIAHVFTHGPKSLSDIAPDSGIDERDAPVVLRLAVQQLDFGPKLRNGTVRIDLGTVIEKKLLDCICLVAETKDEFLMPV